MFAFFMNIPTFTLSYLPTYMIMQILNSRQHNGFRFAFMQLSRPKIPQKQQKSRPKMQNYNQNLRSFALYAMVFSFQL